MLNKILLPVAGLLLSVLAPASLQAARPALQLHRSVEVTADAGGSLRPARVLPGGGGTYLRYWADPSSSRILRSDAQGGQVEEVAAGLNKPYGLGFDTTAQRFVWTSSGDESVQMLSPGTQSVTTLTASFDQPPVLELSTEGDRQAITLVGNELVSVTENAQSGEVITEVLMQVAAPEDVHGLALDAQAGVLYVGNAVGMMAQRLRLDDKSVLPLTFTDHVPPVADPDEGEPL